MFAVVANLLQTRRQEVRLFHACYEKQLSILKRTPAIESCTIYKSEEGSLEADIVHAVKDLHTNWCEERLWERRPSSAKPVSEDGGSDKTLVFLDSTAKGEEESGLLALVRGNWKVRRLIMSPFLILGFIALTMFANKRRSSF